FLSEGDRTIRPDAPGGGHKGGRAADAGDEPRQIEVVELELAGNRGAARVVRQRQLAAEVITSRAAGEIVQADPAVGRNGEVGTGLERRRIETAEAEFSGECGAVGQGQAKLAVARDRRQAAGGDVAIEGD